MSLLHDRELADTLEDEAVRRRRSNAKYAAALEREARVLRGRGVSLDRLAKYREARDLEGRGK